MSDSLRTRLSKWLGIAILVLAFLVWTVVHDDTEKVLFGAALFLGGVFLKFFIEYLRTRDRVRAQRNRNSSARRIASDLRSGAVSTDYVLFLRPFRGTNILFSTLDRLGADKEPTSFDFEMYATAQFEKLNFPVICAGASSNNDGAGSLEFDEGRWKSEVLMLMRAAKIIIAVPSMSPGSWWEIETIVREGLLPKCAFVQPPSSDNIELVNDLPSVADLFAPENEFASHSGQDFKKQIRTKMALDWTAIQRSCQELGFEIPGYHPWGQLFRIVPTEGIRSIKPQLLRPIFRGNRFADAVLILFE
jgi:hypothetical protein